MKIWKHKIFGGDDLFEDFMDDFLFLHYGRETVKIVRGEYAH